MENGSKKHQGYTLIGLHFLDHTESKGTPDDLQPDDTRDLSAYECFVVGWLMKEDEDAYHVTSWVCDGSLDDWETRVDTILKTTLLSPIMHLANIDRLPKRQKKKGLSKTR